MPQLVGYYHAIMSDFILTS